ncbi:MULTISPECIES: hypothetical protein [unclassified Paenibacillus]|uniref:hypothetical protein n=1 Tax=unclassified Paenibacillus TaxID=185978 RepID=UPI0027802459|nr:MULTISPECIES: hypothetical protein [unclassified Paenibacillus]MDQ0897287.1 hypothetical protein [Paenibacillus sp. V4I7]MDQ0916567.1 hypothetical protein [Paenibacillus sp. V4I5]
MADIMLRPDLKTAGGEVCDIMYNGKFVGTLTLVYRESDRLKGSIHLEQQSITTMDKQKVYEFVQSYIQNVIDALAIEECEVLVSYSDYDFVIASDHALEPTMLEEDSHSYTRHEHDDEVDYEWVRDETRFDDIDSENAPDQMEMIRERKNQQGYELVIVGESRNRVDYHVYDNDSELIAEITLHMYGTDVIGDISWRFDPFDEEMDRVSELIVEDFNEDETDTFIFNMIYNGETVDTVELTHIDLLDLVDDIEEDTMPLSPEDYTINLARDDGDTLTYEIYQQSYGGLPIGTATVDISSRQLTGFIDFREPGDSDDRELIATLLLEELDKEKEYETFNVSMLYRNKLIDEIWFETDQYH